MRIQDWSASWQHYLASGALKKDFPSSIVVFLVALPLCLGIAIASGAPPMLGLISGIIGGIVIGSLSGAPLQVSGPAAGLVALVYEAIQKHGLEGLGWIVLIAGLVQITAGYLKLGQWFRAISPAVIQGMLAGIGILIMSSQFHVMLDVPPESSGLVNLMTIPDSLMKGLFPMDSSSHHWAALLGVTTIGLILFWNTLRIHVVPSALVAVLGAVLIGWLMQLPVQYVDMPDNLLAGIVSPLAHPHLLMNSSIWIMGLTIAIIASAETMLSSMAVDRMHQGSRTNAEKEMIAQGVGNSLAGLLGALPITGVIVRSSANIMAGAQTRVSAILHGIWILTLVTAFPFILELIPTASLAAVLVYTGYKLVQPQTIRKIWQQGRSEFVIYAVTLVMVVATNLLEGVIAGVILSLIRLLYQLTKLEGKSVAGEDGRVDLYLAGSATFLSLPKLINILERQPLGKQLTVHLEELGTIDHACMELLQSWEEQYRKSGGIMKVEWHRTGLDSETGNGSPQQSPVTSH